MTGKVWMVSEPYRQPDGRWVPKLRVLEESAGGTVQDIRVLTGAGMAVATEAEARAECGEIARHLLRCLSSSRLGGDEERD